MKIKIFKISMSLLILTLFTSIGYAYGKTRPVPDAVPACAAMAPTDSNNQK